MATAARRQPDEGLVYPFGREGPATGEFIPVAEGVGWARLPVPGSLRHINVWALDDGDGVALVDTGLDIAQCRDAWDAVFAGPLADRRVTRIIVTHFHPDHVGLAGWLCRRFDVPLWMNRTEYLLARLAIADQRPEPPAEQVAQRVAAGWSEAQVDAERGMGWGRFAQIAAPLPVGHVAFAEGDELAIGNRRWRVMTGSGHTPEHCALVDVEGGLMIAGDQLLPRISSNISLGAMEPEADPLADWLASLARFERDLDPAVLVLPAHGEPFTGAHIRLAALAAGHTDRLDALELLLREAPRRAVDCFVTLFGREIDDSVIGLATGEALAHLRWLERAGRARRDVRDGVWWFST